MNYSHQIKGVSILGSTGSIGTQSLEIIAAEAASFRVVALAAGKNIERLRGQITKFRPEVVSVEEPWRLQELRREFPDTKFFSGQEGLAAAVDAPGIDIVIVGIVGFAALQPTLHAVRAGKIVALANKEALVVSGAFLKKEIEISGATCIPVDSEHNALYQLLRNQTRSQVKSLVLTASGGPLWSKKDFPLQDVTPALATTHPNWKMGPKISVDSATLMNKGLELIEAHYLFDFPANQIEVWVHPQSIVHGAIWLNDNTCLAQLSKPDMKASLGYALAFPERISGVIPKLNFSDFSRLEFFPPDDERFPALRLAREALQGGQSYLVSLNAGNEVAVQSFLEGKILFPQMAHVLTELLSRHPGMRLQNLEEVFELDLLSRREAGSIVQQMIN